MHIGVIVARFQTPFLHEGHQKLLQLVADTNDKTILFLGTNGITLTQNNPLSFEIRKQMVQSFLPNIDIYPLADTKDNTEWDSRLDQEIDLMTHKTLDIITLYGDRGSFIEGYKGKFKTQHANITVLDTSATKIRQEIGQKPLNTSDFRAGIVYAAYNKPSICYPTVGVAVIDWKKKRVLLGKKPNEKKFGFFGGFANADDKNLEATAKRTLDQQTTNQLETQNFRYIASTQINHWQYKTEKDVLLCIFFACDYLVKHATPDDQIAQTQWFDFGELNQETFESEHLPLFEALNHVLNRY